MRTTLFNQCLELNLHCGMRSTIQYVDKDTEMGKMDVRLSATGD